MPRRNKPRGEGPPKGGTQVLYPIHEGPQLTFMESTVEEVMYGGAAFGGKSYALRAILVSYCLTYPGATAVLFRRTFPELEDTHIRMLKVELPSYIAEYNSSSHEFRFANGSSLLLRYCEKEDDVRSYDCVGIETPILTSDLRWVPAGDLKVGDELLGFDEYPTGKLRRNLKKAKVVRQNIVMAPTHAIHLADGRVIHATPEHKWLVKDGSGTLTWYRTDELYKRHHSSDPRLRKPITLRQAMPVTEPSFSYESGFLSAAFDGEGCLVADKKNRCGLQMNFTQKDNAMLDKVKGFLSDLGYPYKEYTQPDKKSPTQVLRINGGTQQKYRLLMETQPPRLLAKFQDRLIDELQVPTVGDIEITDIGPLEEHEIAEISSTSKTYIADGFLAHNTFEADIMGFDELTAFSLFQYTYLITRCRSTKPWWRKENGGPGRQIRSATNPGNVGHAWVKKRFIDPMKPYEIIRGPEEEGGMTRQFIPAKAEDNITGMISDPDYVKVLKGLPDEEYRAKALGDWSVFSGQFFSRWRDGVHVCEPFQIPASWRRYIFVDWGLAAPHAVYWAARPPDTNSVWLYREQYGANISTREQARLAAEKTRGNQEKIEMIIADPAMWARERNADGDYLMSNIDYWKHEFAGLCDLVKGNNERIQGASVFRECLDWQGIELSTGVTVLVPPRLKVFRTCENFIRTVPALIHDKTHVEDVDTKGEDHSYDAVRYGLRFLFTPAPVRGHRRVIDTPNGLVVLDG